MWQKAYNNTITGHTWNYPEFLGYYADVNWVEIENKESSFIVYSGDKNRYFQMLHPPREMDALKNNNVEPPFPEGNIGFLSAISAMGTKFHPAKAMGPEGEINSGSSEKLSGTLWFDFIH